MSHFEIVTRFSKEIIEQELRFPYKGDLIQHMTKNVLKLQDEGVKKALITLGWTPPNKSGMIILNTSIDISMMSHIIKVLSYYHDRELSHFCAEEYGDCVDLLAYFPGNAMFPGIKTSVIPYPLEHREACEKMAQDLNTLFNLKVPVEDLANS